MHQTFMQFFELFKTNLEGCRFCFNPLSLFPPHSQSLLIHLIKPLPLLHSCHVLCLCLLQSLLFSLQRRPLRTFSILLLVLFHLGHPGCIVVVNLSINGSEHCRSGAQNALAGMSNRGHIRQGKGMAVREDFASNETNFEEEVVPHLTFFDKDTKSNCNKGWTNVIDLSTTSQPFKWDDNKTLIVICQRQNMPSNICCKLNNGFYC